MEENVTQEDLMNNTTEMTKLEYGDSGNELSIYGADISSTICKPFVRILEQNRPVTGLFFELVNKFDKFFSIAKAVLVVSNSNNNVLRMVAVWDNSRLREGVMLTLPQNNSLLYRALENGTIINEPVFGKFPGNYIEKRILTDKSVRSLVICPLHSDDVTCGLFSLASPVPCAFELIGEGRFDHVFQRFGELLSQESMIGQ